MWCCNKWCLTYLTAGTLISLSIKGEMVQMVDKILKGRMVKETTISHGPLQLCLLRKIL